MTYIFQCKVHHSFLKIVLGKLDDLKLPSIWLVPKKILAEPSQNFCSFLKRSFTFSQPLSNIICELHKSRLKSSKFYPKTQHPGLGGPAQQHHSQYLSTAYLCARDAPRNSYIPRCYRILQLQAESQQVVIS